MSQSNEGWTHRGIWLAAAALLSATQHAAPQADVIPWRSARPLEWSDFVGPVDPNAAPDTAAITSASLNWRYDYSIERGRGRCFFRITEISTEAQFHPDDSWVRPEHRTSIILEHEQGHFDLTQVYKLMLDAAAVELLDREQPCGRADASPGAVEQRLAATVQPLRNRIWDALQRVQAEYDAATRHGIREDVQREWTARIQAALARGEWR